MLGTISLYDRRGERQHTACIAAALEHGGATFLLRMQREVEQVKRLYPQAHYQGLADGAKRELDVFRATHPQMFVRFLPRDAVSG